MIKNNTPLFSIVIPTYNHGHLIHRCIESILAQTCTNWEAIIINNYSSDNTVDVVMNYKDPRIKLINNANNGIIAVSRNKGIEEAKGTWICFLDSDDWWFDRKLEECIPFLNEFNLIYHDLQIFDSNGGKLFRKVTGRQLLGDYRKDLIINGNAIPNSSVIVKSEIIRSIGLFSERKDMFAIEDSDCWIRIAAVTDKFKYINKALGVYWIGNNTSSSIIQLEREEILLNKHFENLSNKELKLAFNNLYYRQARILHKQSMFVDASKMYRMSIPTSKKRTIYALLFMIVTLLKIKY